MADHVPPSEAPKASGTTGATDAPAPGSSGSPAERRVALRGTSAAPARAVRVRWRFVVLGALCVGAIAWLVFGALRENIVYLEPVSHAVDKRAEQGERRFRMGGAVVPCTISETTDGVRFEITEGDVVATVRHRGDPPDLFDDGAPVVVEGRWQGETFASERLLIRHGEEYTPESVELDRSACDEGAASP